MPAIQSSFKILLNMLSIKVWVRLVNLVGEVMLGTRLVEYMVLRKSETFLFESHFRRSVLKSSSNISTLFSLINFSEKGFRYSSLNALCCIHGCLYMHPTTMFLVSLWIISIETDSNSFFHKPLNLVLAYS